MKAARRYLDFIEQWDGIAEQGRYADNWADDMAMEPNIYLRDCIQNDILPTFRGFMLYLSTIAPTGAESEAHHAE